MRPILVILLLLAGASGTQGVLPPGKYTFINVGFRTVNQEAVYLGFTNKTCEFQTPIARPASEGSDALWKTWVITITGYHSSGAPVGYMSTVDPDNKDIRCPGYLAATNPGICGSSTVDIHPTYKPLWRFVEVKDKPKTYTVLLNVKSADCPRYLTVSQSTQDPVIKMIVSTSISTLTQWELVPLEVSTTKPGKPSFTSITRSPGVNGASATVLFKPPTDVGCPPITQYEITATPLTGGHHGATITKTFKASAPSVTLKKLVSTMRYKFTLAAINECGAGEAAVVLESSVLSDGVVAAGTCGHVCAIKTDSSLQCFDNAGASMRRKLQNNMPHRRGLKMAYREGPSAVLWSFPGLEQDTRSGYTGVADTALLCEFRCMSLHDCVAWMWKGGSDKSCFILTPKSSPPYFSNTCTRSSCNFGYLPTCNENAVRVPSKWAKGNDIVQMVTNAAVTTVVSRNGTVGIWGESQSSSSCSSSSGESSCPSPTFLTGAASVHGWAATTCITLQDGRAQCFGAEIDGTGSMKGLTGYRRENSPNGIGGGYLVGVASVNAGSNTACVIYNNGNLQCWGKKDGYTAGTPLPASYFKNVMDVGIAERGLCVLKSSGDVACSSADVVPGSYGIVNIPSGFSSGVAKLDCAGSSCCALKTTGEFTCWSKGDMADIDKLAGLPKDIRGNKEFIWRCLAGSRRSLRATCLRWPAMNNVVSFTMSAEITCMVNTDGDNQCWFSDPDALARNGNSQMIALSGYNNLG